ncbi:Tetratricopeptide repeat protein 8 [Parelaphostrongylus tenuis]|uniref:Tetratricopeptide repeat protein 8 n=1 Tax=Parelaphostrongylus tenuis TaxID=148309 RepID=A0AAD5QEU1_PARTN|nr:Tetratricopeptide repeat protein 8 [Parelaphostrongylus tenuis]
MPDEKASSVEVPHFDGLFKALLLFRNNQIQECKEECTNILSKNPLDLAAWALKLSCLTDPVYVDELENEELGIAEAFLDHNVIAPNARPGTSFQRPITTAKAMNPIMRPTSTAGRPLSGVSRPMTSLRNGTMEQAVRTSRTARTARAVSSNSARQLRLGTASMASNSDGPFVMLQRLNIDKYGADPMVNRQLFEYVFLSRRRHEDSSSRQKREKWILDQLRRQILPGFVMCKVLDKTVASFYASAA